MKEETPANAGYAGINEMKKVRIFITHEHKAMPCVLALLHNNNYICHYI